MKHLLAIALALSVACESGSTGTTEPDPDMPRATVGWQFGADCPNRVTVFTVEAASSGGTVLTGAQYDDTGGIVHENEATVNVSYGAGSVTYSEDPGLEAFGLTARTGTMARNPDTGFGDGYEGDGAAFCGGEGVIRLVAP